MKRKKGLFSGWFEEKETPQEVEEPKVEESTPAHANAGSHSHSVQSATAKFAPVVSNVPDQKYVTQLGTLLEEKDLPGIDYMEFADAYRDYISRGKSKAEACIAAFDAMGIAAKATGGKVTRESLLSAADFYIGELEQIESDFISQDCKTKISNAEQQIGGQIKSIDGTLGSLKTEEEGILQRLKEIKTERANAEKRKGQLEEQLNQKVAEQNNRIGKMKVAVEAVSANINADKETITQNIPSQTSK
jgi:hypothetical protein